MHESAIDNAQKFATKYLGDSTETKNILDIGSLNLNGSLRKVFKKDKWKYTGIDIQKGRGVDIQLKDPYTYPFEDSSFDAVVSSSCFEHCEMFWLAFNEMVRVTKDGGHIYLNAPFKDGMHREPVDCWRFLPDGMKALAKWNPLAKYLEGYIDLRPHRDCVGIFVINKGSL